MERYFVSQSECWKIRTRKTTNTDTFHAVSALIISPFFSCIHFFDYYLVVREKSHPIKKVRLEILALSNRVTTRVFCKIIAKLWLIYLSANVPWVLLKFILYYHSGSVITLRYKIPQKRRIWLWTWWLLLSASCKWMFCNKLF